MTKKVYTQKMFFSILTNEVLTKHWVTFKRWDGIRVFQIAVRGEWKFPSVKEELEIFFFFGGGIFLPKGT